MINQEIKFMLMHDNKNLINLDEIESPKMN